MLKSFVVVACFAMFLGCAQDKRVSYVPPTYQPSELATLKGGWGTYIQEIGGARVDSASITLDNYGGNTVVVTPGWHDLFVQVHTSSMLAFHNTGAHFRYELMQGHLYEFGPENLLSTNVRVTDKTTGKTEVMK